MTPWAKNIKWKHACTHPPFLRLHACNKMDPWPMDEPVWLHARARTLSYSTQGGLTNERPGSGHVTWGPMRGLEKNAWKGTNTQTDRQTDGHRDSMTDPAQRAESVKTYLRRLWKVVHYENPPRIKEDQSWNFVWRDSTDSKEVLWLGRVWFLAN